MKRAWPLLAFAACAGHAASPIAVGPTSVAPTSTPWHRVVDVEEVADATYVLDDSGVTVVRAGTIAATATVAGGFVGGATITALDGDGQWVVGVDTHGSIWRITSTAELRDIDAQLGVHGVHAIASSNHDGTLGLQLADGVAASLGGVDLQSARLPALAIAAAHGRVALLTADTVTVWQLASSQASTYAVGGARFIAFRGADLMVATNHELYVEHASSLHRVVTNGSIDALVVSAARPWLLVGQELVTLGDDDRLHRANSSRKVDATKLFAAPNGDVWLATSHSPSDDLRRVGVIVASNLDSSTWRASVAPIFARVCAHCHLPGGSAGVDLSTVDSWSAERDELRDRVVVNRSMPPAGTVLSDSDRAALASWLGHE